MITDAQLDEIDAIQKPELGYHGCYECGSTISEYCGIEIWELKEMVIEMKQWRKLGRELSQCFYGDAIGDFKDRAKQLLASIEGKE